MAITFGKKNQRIQENLRTRFIGDNNQGVASYTDFVFRDIDNTNYITGVYLFSGTRADLADYENANTTWNGDGYLQNHASCIAYWEFNNASSVYPYYTNSTPTSTSYVKIGNRSIEFTPSYLNRKVGTRNGTITWFAVQTHYNGSSRGLLTGSVGVAGSGADLIIQIVDSAGAVIRNDTYLSTSTYVDCPRGLKLNIPSVPATPVLDELYHELVTRKILDNPNPSASDYFGWSVDINANYAIVSSQREDSPQSDSGMAYIFNTSTGSLYRTLTNPNPNTNYASDYFGHSVAISDSNYCVVGAPYEDNASNVSNVGKAYVFTTTGTLVATLNNPREDASDYFGWAVGIDGTNVIVGSQREDAVGSDQGSAYIFNTSGTLLHTLENPEAGTSTTSDWFGSAVAISGNYCIVGAHYTDDPEPNSGKAYIFNVSTGELVHTLDNPIPGASDYFGYSVDIQGNYAIVGAYLDDTTGTDSGTAYVFNVTTGELVYTFTDPNEYSSSTSDYFGFSVGISDTYAVVGAYGEDDGGSGSGSVYFFSLEDGSYMGFAKNPNDYSTGSSDYFGYSVAVHGKTVVAGAHGEDSINNGDEGKAYILKPRVNFRPVV